MLTLKKEKHQAHKIQTASGDVVHSPADHLMSAVAMCMALTMDAVIARDGLMVDFYQLELAVEKDPALRPRRFTGMDVSIVVGGEITDHQREKLKQMAKRGCVIGHTLEHGLPIRLSDGL